MYLVKVCNFHPVGNWGFLIQILDFLFQSMKFLCPEESNTFFITCHNLLFLLEVKFIWTTLCQEGIKLCVGLL